MTRPYPCARRPAVTLLELILALSLIVLVCGLMFGFYDASLRSREWGARRIVDGQLARVIAMKIAEEIRSANGNVGSMGPGISGERRRIKLQTIVLPDKDSFWPRAIDDDPLPGQCDIREVQYYLAYDQDQTHDYPDGSQGWAPLGLVRREVRTLGQTAVFENKAESVDLDLLAPEMKYLRFRYFDGIDWLDKWDPAKGGAGGLGNALPVAVEVTVGYTELPSEEEEKFNLDDKNQDLQPSVPEPYSPETYSVVVCPAADEFLGPQKSLTRPTDTGSSLGGGLTQTGIKGF